MKEGDTDDMNKGDIEDMKEEEGNQKNDHHLIFVCYAEGYPSTTSYQVIVHREIG